MRLAFLALSFAITGCTNSPTSVPTAVPSASLESQIIGSWRSENVGLDFPMWLVDTYRVDRTVTTVVISKPKTEEVRHDDLAIHHFWRVTKAVLEVGNKTDAGQIEREGRPRPLIVAEDGLLIGIQGWTREQK
jgi:hypothetical protein